MRLARGSPVALAAVTWASGSTARGTDALMAMDESGAMTGTVGGGFAEGQTITAMRELFSAQPATTDAPSGAHTRDLKFDLSPEASQSQMTCGGALSIHLERIEPGSKVAWALLACFARVGEGQRAGIAFFDIPNDADSTWTAARDAPTRAAEAFAEDYTVIGADLGLSSTLRGLLRASEPGFCGAAMLPLPQSLNPALSVSSSHAFWLGFSPDPTVFIFGAGHVGFATCEAASLAGFSVIVTDDRPELLTVERFPRAKSLRHIESFASPLAAGPHCRAIAPGPLDCTLILTRKPDIDQEMLASLLTTRAGYIGLIGSKTKRQGIFASLKKQGFSDAELSRVHAPIGLAIGARTPEEIAISIIAEIIAVRAGILPAEMPRSRNAADGIAGRVSESAPPAEKH